MFLDGDGKPLRGEALRIAQSMKLEEAAGEEMSKKFDAGVSKQGQLRSKMKMKNEEIVKFKDVAGIGDAKIELAEVVDFFRKPEKFKKSGATVPKGVMLTGPPGCGKTLLARAVAGESGATFFSITASEFVEMFVGVGRGPGPYHPVPRFDTCLFAQCALMYVCTLAEVKRERADLKRERMHDRSVRAARVRDLFAQAKRQAPSIIFIDELDAIGRPRGGGGRACHLLRATSRDAL